MHSFIKKSKVFTVMLMTLIIIILFSITVFAGTPSEAKDSVVVVAIYDNTDSLIGWGSGFAIGEPGKPIQYIVTNCHVAEPRDSNNNIIQSSVKVFFSAAANKFMGAEVYWKNWQKDLAVLKLPEPTTERKAMVLCPVEKLDTDDVFTALGYPAASMTADFVKFDKSDISITKGGISKQVRINETDCFLLDLQISEGNSGGPLVNSKGEVVGINTFYILEKAKDANSADVKSNYAVAIDELIRNINRKVIPYTIKGELTQLQLLYIGIGVIVVILAVVFILVLISKKKSRGNYDQHSAKFKQPLLNNPTASTDTIFIFGVSGPLSNKKFDVDGRIVIGRDPSRCEIAFPLDTPGVSGTHCELTTDNNSLLIKDLYSTYGTFLADGTKLISNIPVKINVGDIFYLGGEDNKFEVR